MIGGHLAEALRSAPQALHAQETVRVEDDIENLRIGKASEDLGAEFALQFLANTPCSFDPRRHMLHLYSCTLNKHIDNLSTT